MNYYQPDTLVKLSTTFTDADGETLIDPTTITLYMRTPDGVVTAYTSSEITHVGLGLFEYEVVTDQIGPWIYKWQGTGTCEITSPDVYFQVVDSAVMKP